MNLLKQVLSVFALSLVVLAAGALAVFAQDAKKPYFLRVTYIEFPPYYFTNSAGNPDGFLLKKADGLLRAAGVEPVYESLSADRVLLEMRGPNPVCSIGWFKTPKREKFARFSKAIYHSRPLHVLFLVQNGDRVLKGRDSLAELLKDKTLSLGVAHGYSYGSEVDRMIAEGDAMIVPIMGGHPQLVYSLAAGAFDFMLATPEGIETLINMNRLSPVLFGSVRMRDLPSGSDRHFMFNRSVPLEILKRVDLVINSQ